MRIAMTVAEAGTHDGLLFEVTREAGLDTDDPVVELREAKGRINADLTVGVDVELSRRAASQCRPRLSRDAAALAPALS